MSKIPKHKKRLIEFKTNKKCSIYTVTIDPIDFDRAFITQTGENRYPCSVSFLDNCTVELKTFKPYLGKDFSFYVIEIEEEKVTIDERVLKLNGEIKTAVKELNILLGQATDEGVEVTIAEFDNTFLGDKEIRKGINVSLRVNLKNIVEGKS